MIDIGAFTNIPLSVIASHSLLGLGDAANIKLLYHETKAGHYNQLYVNFHDFLAIISLSLIVYACVNTIQCVIYLLCDIKDSLCRK